MIDGYDDAQSDTDSVADSKTWPKVCHGMFTYTEQQPNPNGGGGGRVLKRPVIHFWTGSNEMNNVLEAALKKKTCQREFHADYSDMKNAVFGHRSIPEPQVNKTKLRTKKRQEKKDEHS